MVWYDEKASNENVLTSAIKIKNLRNISRLKEENGWTLRHILNIIKTKIVGYIEGRKLIIRSRLVCVCVCVRAEDIYSKTVKGQIYRKKRRTI